MPDALDESDRSYSRRRVNIFNGGESVEGQSLEKLFHMIPRDHFETAQALADKLGVSSKTIRMRIKSLAEILQRYGAEIEGKNGCGYRIDIKQPEKYELFHEEILSHDDGMVPQTASERVVYIIEYLLNVSGFVKAETLSSILFVSTKTLSSDLKMAESILLQYNISLLRKPYYGIGIQGSEKDIRDILSDNIIKNGHSVILDTLFQNDDFRSIYVCLNKCFQCYDYHIPDIAFQDIVIHVYVSILRIRNNHSIDYDPAWDPYIYANNEFRIAQEVASQIIQIFDVHLSNDEVCYLAVQLAAKRGLDPLSFNRRENVAEGKAGEVVEAVIRGLKESLGYNFAGDLELQAALRSYILPLEIRLRFGIRQSNPFVESIKEQFTLAYELAVVACKVIGTYYQRTVDENEISVSTMAFELALERYKPAIQKKNILLVCSSNVLAVEWLRYKYKEELREFVGQIYACDIRGLDTIDFDNVDYVFSSEPLPMPHHVPVMRIGYIYDDRDFYNNCHLMRQALTKSSQDRITKYFDSRLFFTDVALSSKEEILRFMCEQAGKVKGISEDIYGSVIEREALSSTSDGHRVAVPHAMKAFSPDTFVCVCLLKEPVIWKWRPVEIVCLILIGKEDNKSLQILYQSLYRLFANERSMKELASSHDYMAFEQLLKSTEDGLFGS